MKKELPDDFVLFSHVSHFESFNSLICLSGCYDEEQLRAKKRESAPPTQNY